MCIHLSARRQLLELDRTNSDEKEDKVEDGKASVVAGQFNDSWSVGYNGGCGEGQTPLLGLILLAGSEAKTKRLLDRKAVKRNN